MCFVVFSSVSIEFPFPEFDIGYTPIELISDSIGMASHGYRANDPNRWGHGSKNKCTKWICFRFLQLMFRTRRHNLTKTTEIVTLLKTSEKFKAITLQQFRFRNCIKRTERKRQEATKSTHSTQVPGLSTVERVSLGFAHFEAWTFEICSTMVARCGAFHLWGLNFRHL